MIKNSKPKRPLTVIGWRERISLPQLGLEDFAIKVDTGAKTTALHAENITQFEKDEVLWVQFDLPQIEGHPPATHSFPILEQREITNTSGVPESRIVIQNLLRLGGRMWKIDISLTDRSLMRYPLILGRRALRRHKIAVHTGRSYLVSDRHLQPKE